MKNTLLFPLCLILFNFGAAIMHLFSGDIKKVVYYIAAAVLNITVMI